MNSSHNKRFDTHQPIYSIHLWIFTPLLLIGACSSGNLLDTNEPLVTQTSTQVSVPQASVNQPVTVAAGTDLLESTQSAQVDMESDIPEVAAATTSNSQYSLEGLGPESIVTCSAPIEHIQQRSIQIINEVRAQARNCGSDYFEATSPLLWNTRLLQAAVRHSNDMTQHNFFDHTGSDGSTIASRVTETGYLWRAVGENIAAGQRSIAEIVAGWLTSPGHCRNLMNPTFTEVAVTCSENQDTDYSSYWTNVLASTQ